MQYKACLPGTINLGFLAKCFATTAFANSSEKAKCVRTRGNGTNIPYTRPAYLVYHEFGLLGKMFRGDSLCELSEKAKCVRTRKRYQHFIHEANLPGGL